MAVSLLPGPRVAAETGRARREFEHGRRQLAAGAHVEALAAFHRASLIVGRPSILLNIGQCLRLLDQPTAAVRYYRDYLRAAASASGGRAGAGPAPYAKEVARHLARLGALTARFERASRLQRAGDHVGALVELSGLRSATPWPRVELALARSHLALGRVGETKLHLDRAARAYRELLGRWATTGSERSGLPGGEAVERDLTTLAALSRRVRGARAARARPPEPDRAKRARRGERPGPSTSSRQTGWLVGAIATAAVGVGAEVVGLVFAHRANQIFTNDPDFPTQRNLSIAGHVTAGVMGAAAGICLYLYFTRPATGRDRTGRDMTGRDMTGRDMTGRDMTGRDMTGRDMTGRDMTGLDRTGRDREARRWLSVAPVAGGLVASGGFDF